MFFIYYCIWPNLVDNYTHYTLNYPLECDNYTQGTYKIYLDLSNMFKSVVFVQKYVEINQK